ncbi:MAG: hypothetical protein IIW86_05445 [Clostridia bacterium]|nr:hypothetical protein [Clostridia bacterium]
MSKKPLFYKIYFSVLAVFAVLLVVILFLLGGWLKDYEAGQPATIVNGIIENNLKTGNVYALKTGANLALSPYDAEDAVNAAVKSKVEGKEFSASSSAKRPEGCDMAYVVKSGDEKIMQVYLRRVGKASAIGTSKYEVMGCELDKSFYTEINLSMPENAEIEINGVPLDKKERKDVELTDSIKKELGNKEYNSRQTAKLKNLISADVTVTATQDGKKLEVVKNGNDISVLQFVEEKEKADILKFATDASKTYAAYMQEDSSLGKVAAYFDKKCEFYENIRTSLVMFALDHESYRFDDVKNGDVYKYSDDVYCCRVEFTQVLVRRGKEYKDHFKKNIFLKKSGKSYLVFDMQGIEG